MAYFEYNPHRHRKKLERARQRIVEATNLLVASQVEGADPSEVLMSGYWSALTEISQTNPSNQVEYDIAHGMLQERVAVIPESPDALSQMGVVLDLTFISTELAHKPSPRPAPTDVEFWQASAAEIGAL